MNISAYFWQPDLNDEYVKTLTKYTKNLSLEDRQCIKILQHLKNGVDINTRDDKGNTTLMNCCQSANDIKCVELLLQYGADVNIQNDGGRTALRIAKNNYNVKCIKLLSQYNVDVTIKDKYGTSILNMIYFYSFFSLFIPYFYTLSSIEKNNFIIELPYDLHKLLLIVCIGNTKKMLKMLM